MMISSLKSKAIARFSQCDFHSHAHSALGLTVDHSIYAPAVNQCLEHHLPAIVQRAHSRQFGIFDVFELRAVAGGKNALLKT
jgi:hypothetical protein